MNKTLRQLLTSLGLGLLAAGILSAVLVTNLPARWRHPVVVWGVVLASIAGVAWARGVRRPEP